MLNRSVIVEHEVSIVDFEELKYMGRSIDDIMDDQRPIGAYPTVEMANKLDAEGIFCTFMGQNVVLVGPFIRQKLMLPFWCILHLIFSYIIKRRAHTIECLL
ncbi:hypothetical protein CJ030_MR2G020040 [Morella rubra]|uniref:Uncharacterized protein n=1 Tax=Morella rubra TaxID=262757 RepID=A0A6A1WCI6_9ROSI|nr:hypothetical protein CJ030_MR2G020040 [Morella rubra]